MKRVKTIRAYMKLLQFVESHGIADLKGYEYLDRETQIDIGQSSVFIGNEINCGELFHRIDEQLQAKIINPESLCSR